MNRLESRIERLEAQLGARSKPLVIRVVSWMDGDVIGFSTPTGNVMRKPGESEEELEKRAYLGAHGYWTIGEIREGNGKPYVHPYEVTAPTVAVSIPEKPEPARQEGKPRCQV